MVDPPDRARDGLASVTRGTLVMILGTLGSVGLVFVSRVILIRILDYASWSTFSLALTIVGVASALATLGLPQAVARNLAYVSTDADRRAIVRTAFRFLVPAAVAISATLFALAIVFASVYQDPQLGQTLEIFSAVVGLGVISTLVASVFQGYEDARPNAIFVQVLNPMLFIGFLLAAGAALPSTERYLGATFAYLLSGILVLAGIFLFLRHRLPRLLPEGPATPGLSRRLILFALPLLAVGVLTSVSGSADTLILGFLNRAQIGYYTATLSLARLLGVGLGALGYIFLPVAARFLGQRDPSSLRLTYATATKWTVVVSLPLFVLFFFLPDRSLGFVYGSAYATTVLPLRIVVTGAFVATLFGPAGAAQIAFGQTRLVLYNTLVAAVTDVVLSFVLVPGYGETGAAIAWAVSILLFPILSTAELTVLEGLHPFERDYLVPLFGTAVPAGLVFGLLPFAAPYWSLPLIGVGIAVLFVIVVLVTRSIDLGDRLLLEVVERLLGRPLPFVRRLGRWLSGLPPSGA